MPSRAVLAGAPQQSYLTAFRVHLGVGVLTVPRATTPTSEVLLTGSGLGSTLVAPRSRLQSPEPAALQLLEEALATMAAIEKHPPLKV